MLWGLAEDYLASQVVLGAPDQRKILAVCMKYGIEHDEAVLVAEDDELLVGFVAWTHLPDAADGEVVAAGTYVAPDYRERGISNALRAAAKDRCREKGYRFVSGTVLTENHAGVQAVASSGGKIVGYIVRYDLRSSSQEGSRSGRW